jgi:hypothetical protein
MCMLSVLLWFWSLHDFLDCSCPKGEARAVLMLRVVSLSHQVTVQSCLPAFVGKSLHQFILFPDPTHVGVNGIGSAFLWCFFVVIIKENGHVGSRSYILILIKRVNCIHATQLLQKLDGNFILMPWSDMKIN